MVLDGNGTPVWYRRVPIAGAFNVDRRDDGSISYVPSLGDWFLRRFFTP